MATVSAFLVTGNPLPLFRNDNQPWKPIIDGFETARASLEASRPDTLLVYSTQWIAVLDQLWQTRPNISGIHVDENWHAYGDLEFDFTVDSEFATKCVEGSSEVPVNAKSVDYDAFPIDTGTIVANHFLNPRAEVPLVIGSNNVYHDPATTEKLAAMAVSRGNDLERRIAVIAIGGLSSSYFDHHIDIEDDRILNEKEDEANHKFLDNLSSAGNSDAVRDALATYKNEAATDMGMKHMHWLLGAAPNLREAKVHGYGAVYGTGNAVVEFAV